MRTFKNLVFLLILVLIEGPALAHSLCEADLVSLPITTETEAYKSNFANGRLKNLSGKSQRLTIATWNMNLLNVRGWKTHFYKVNAQRMNHILHGYLVDRRPDVMLLQEVWSEMDRTVARTTAQLAGFLVVDTPAARYRKHGMMLLLKENAFSNVGPAGFSEFGGGYVFFELIGSVRRGLLWVQATLLDGQKILIGGTHFTAFPKYNGVRESQVSELNQTVQRLSLDSDYTVIGGDLNIPADFKSRPDQPGLDNQLKGLRALYDHLAQSTGFRDLYRSVNLDDPGYTYNPNFTNKLPRNITDRRLDYVFARSLNPAAKFHAVSADLFFKDRIDGTYPSDHYLIETKVDFFKFEN